MHLKNIYLSQVTKNNSYTTILMGLRFIISIRKAIKAAHMLAAKARVE